LSTAEVHKLWNC